MGTVKSIVGSYKIAVIFTSMEDFWAGMNFGVVSNRNEIHSCMSAYFRSILILLTLWKPKSVSEQNQFLPT
jgi:hypothetical protein